MLKITFTFFVSLLYLSCSSSTLGMAGSNPPSHKLWDQLVKKHVKSDGMVDYQGFIADKDQLGKYLDLLSNNAPDRETWSREEQLAYWINAYNAFTVKLIVDNYPVESIRDLGPKLKIPMIKDVWHYKFFKIGGEDSSLDEIEHGILRNEFDEPRIHFAINCASISCPPLHDEAYLPEKINEQLDFVARQFINDPSRNKIQQNRVEISSIFSWFKGDFTKNGSVIDFLNRYSKVKISPDASIKHLDYNWSLND